MTEEEVLGLFETCSNAGRWGDDDARGTLNYVTREKRLEALAEAREGACVSIGRDLVVRGSTQSPPSAMHVLTYAGHEPRAALELLSDVGVRQPLQEARDLLEGTPSLRAAVLQELLERCKQVKAVRLCLARFQRRRDVVQALQDTLSICSAFDFCG